LVLLGYVIKYSPLRHNLFYIQSDIVINLSFKLLSSRTQIATTCFRQRCFQS